MNGNDIRRVFFEFFEARGHTPVPSASLIPIDPTLLLTNAGMVPFKPYMLGEEKAPFSRAVTVQKVARTVDIDIIGTTARHLTFFEMLGNFSFGDYFKEKAIPWAYELVTEGFGLDPDRLWFTVYKDDDEAEQIWIDTVGARPDRVQRFDRDNFWQMGVAGPAGPCSEIFYDKGPEFGLDGGPAVDDERFMEVWNLVFMQYVQDEPYHVVGDLPARNIDTGAGLERLATVLQGVETVFETDLIRPVLAAGEGLTGVSYGSSDSSDMSLRILGDHGRTVTFLIGDGVVPSNEGRGYVLRRLLRRAVRHAFLLGTRDLVMPTIIEATIDVMGAAYPNLVEKRDTIVTMAEREEVRFRRTLESGHQLLDQDLEGIDDEGPFPGATAFKLHDTYGFPIEVTEEILAERGLAVDRTEFDRLMQEQKDRARAAFTGGKRAEATGVYVNLLRGVDATEFTGYDSVDDVGRVLSIVAEGETIERAEKGREVEVFLDRTPFYAESGGQVGDTGRITSPTGELEVLDTQFAVTGYHGHRARVTSGYVDTGQEVAAHVDHDRRERIRKNHTGTHILHWGLRHLVGDHVHQAGSLVEPERLRFDFSHFQGLDREELAEIERAVNERVIENSAVTTIRTTKDQAEAMGALAFFGDKYGNEVRVVQAGDYSVEFCGGTHVHTTGQIGPLLLVSEGSIAANTRRVEALTGTKAYGYLAELRRTLERTAATLGTQPDRVLEAAQALSDRIDAQQERLDRYQQQERLTLVDDLVETVETHGDVSLLVAGSDGLGPDDLRALAYQLRDRLGAAIGVVGSRRDGKGALIAFVSRDLAGSGISAAEVLRPAAAILGGGGSRDPELAQAGGPHGDRLEEALEAAREAARTALLAL